MYLVRHEAFLAVGAVVGHEIEIVADGAHFLFEEEKVAVACADDDIGRNALAVSPFHLGIDGRRANAASNEKETHGGTFVRGGGEEFAGLSQRAYDGVYAVALVHGRKGTGAVAHHLVDDGDGLALGVEVADGEGHALPLVLRDDDDELAGFARTGNPRGLDVHQIDFVAVKQLFAYNLVHVDEVFQDAKIRKKLEIEKKVVSLHL